MSDAIPQFLLPTVEEKIEEDVKFKVIYPKNVLATVASTLSTNIRTKIEFRVLPQITVLLNTNDHYAFIGLPGLDGKIDREATVFGYDMSFREWYKDLFIYYWEKACPYQI